MISLGQKMANDVSNNLPYHRILLSNLHKLENIKSNVRRNKTKSIESSGAGRNEAYFLSERSGL